MSAGRIARVLVGALVGCYVAAGVVAAHRAYFPVGSVRIVVPPGPLRANSAFRIDTITTIRLEGASPSGAGDERRVGRHENGIRWHMERVFVVLRSRGPAWDDSMPLEGQAGWADHAAFMDDLFAKRFAALVGPLEGTRDALLVLRASHSSEITERLAADPWTSSGHLITKQVSPWQLRLGSL